MNECKGTDIGFTGKKQVEIALRAIKNAGGVLKMPSIYDALEKEMNKYDATLSFQGKSSLRFFVNTTSVKKGLIYPYDKTNPGWRITELGRSVVSGDLDNNYDSKVKLPTEEKETNLIEGNLLSILVNKYERNPTARKECLAHFGSRCQVCSLDFSEKYGDIGAGFIHVHHIVSLSEIGKSYKVDPIKDLVPLCPNCHSMIHHSKVTLTIEQLRERISSVELLSDLL